MNRIFGHTVSRSLTVVTTYVFGLLLAGCVATAPQLSGGLPSGSAIAPEPVVEQQGLPAASGRIIGSGSIRVAMLVPRSAQGFGSLAAENFTNAADLALREFDPNTIQIVIKDTGGNAQTAANAARQAISEGAEVILGPVFSSTVPAVASVTRSAGIPLITFSNSTAVGSNGVYVYGFTPEPGIRRAIRFAGNAGNRSFAALLPDNAFGTLAESTFRQSVADVGGRIVSISRYDRTPGNAQAKAGEIAALAQSGQVDAVFVPDAGDIAPQLVTTIKQGAPSAQNLKFIGSGQWDDPRIFRNASLAGAIYPAPDRAGFNKFAQRYNGAFGKPPIRLASLGYDVTSLMIVLAKQFQDNRYSSANLTNPNGFDGLVDGIFRLSANGQVQRSLAVYEVTTAGPRIVSPAPRSFAESALN